MAKTKTASSLMLKSGKDAVVRIGSGRHWPLPRCLVQAARHCAAAW
jgi:hypothetical protein